ncbi:MAG TPA: 8-amino-7-oxononanoate synthase [Nitrospiraceae bacterium]|nr:8-amino-7-oxononanoate synthase [Nitrospiraceae bacterium]
MNEFDPLFEPELSRLGAQHWLRQCRVIESACAPEILYQGRRLILMASNDYLGLANHPAVKEAATQAIRHYGVGAGAARLISGTQPPHHDLEVALAKWKGAEAALCFGSGYLANLGLLPCLAGPQDLILADRLCHASLIDGCRLSRARLRIFHHADIDHLERLLKRRPAVRRTLIVTDGLFSMDGDLAPLSNLTRLATQYEGLLVVDDAHGTGVMGAHGRGSLEACGVEADVPFHMGTLGKALGTSGAYVVGSETFVRFLVNTARTFLFTTSPPAAMAAATIAALELLQREPDRRARLWANREVLFQGLTRMGLRLTATASPILPIIIGDDAFALRVAQALLERGIYAPAIRPPTVPKGSSRIRLTVTAEHTPEHLDQVLHAFQDILASRSLT